MIIFSALAGCSAGDPCSGRSGTCIALTVTGSIAGIDRLAVTVDQPSSETQSTPPGAIHLPITLGLNLPSSVEGVVNLGVTASSNGATIAGGAGQATVSQHRGTASVSLEPNGADLSGDDLARDASAVDDLLAFDAALPPGVPGAPQNVSASSGNAQATVTWAAPSSTGTSAIVSYTVTSSPGGIEITTSGGATTATLLGLTNGTAYTFSVTATNGAGIGPAGVSNPVTPSATPMVPAAPTNVMAAANVDHGATVTWTAPLTTGSSPITSYTITASPGNATVITPDGNTTMAQVTGLTPGTSYQFTVFATNSVGAGPASSSVNSVVVLGKLAAPGGVSACGANGQIKLLFNAVAGAQSYDVFYNPTPPATAGSKANVSGSPATITVPPGSYHVAVAAVNGLGDGAASTEVTALADAQVHDTLFVTRANSWSAFDCFSQVADGTSVPSRNVPGTFGGSLAVDVANAVVWTQGGAGVVGYADATRANGATSATWSMTLASTVYGIALDGTHHKFYALTACPGACGSPTYPLQRFPYAAPSELNTTTPSSEASFSTPLSAGSGAPSQLFLEPSSGNLLGAFISAATEGSIVVYPAAYNLPSQKSFTLSPGANDYPSGVAYEAASGGTLYTSWNIGTSNATDDVTGIDSAASGQLTASGMITASRGLLALGNSMLLVASGTSIQAWSLTAPSGSPIKTVTVADTIYGLFYVP